MSRNEGGAGVKSEKKSKTGPAGSKTDETLGAYRRRVAHIRAGAGQGGPSLGLALGGGGARGFAHISMLEVCDELGVRPKIIAGTSIGSVMGATYASGMTGAEMREYCAELFRGRVELIKRLFGRSGGSFWDLWSPLTPSQVNGEKLFEAVLPESVPKDFAALRTPLKVVATDFYTQSAYVMDEGPLMPAIAASSALPALVKPVEIGHRVLIDGGFVNPLPYDVIKGEADVIAAVDLSGAPTGKDGQSPSMMDVIVGSAQITVHSIVREKLKSGAPDVLLRPRVNHYRVLDFYKMDEMFRDVEPSKEEFKRLLAARMEAAAKIGAGGKAED
jgi:NTE family protein